MKCWSAGGAFQSVRPEKRIVCGGDEQKIMGDNEVENRQAIEADGEVENEIAEYGRREAAKMNDPKLPPRAEVEAHNLTHLPYRSWCKHCVRGRGKELPHEKAKRELEIHEFHFDWEFPG